MKIVHVTEAWNGGIATYVNTLAGWHADKNDIFLVHSESETRNDFDLDFYQSRNIKTIPYPTSRNPAKLLRTARRLNAILNDIDPDIVHLHSAFPGVYGRLSRRKYPLVYCPHGWAFTQEKGAVKKNIYAQVEKRLACRCDAIINISEHEHEKAHVRGVKAPLNVIILSGANDANPKTTPGPIAINPDHINIGFIGRLDYKKGFDIAARAFATLLRTDIHLYAIGAASRDGDGEETPDAPNIHRLGWVNNADIDGYIRLFDAVILSSRQEAFGLAAVEAMRNARPAIVSDAGALPELVRNGYDGYIFKLKSAEKDLPSILRNLDKQKLKIMGQNARASYEEKFTGERMAQDTLQLYERVLYARKTAS